MTAADIAEGCHPLILSMIWEFILASQFPASAHAKNDLLDWVGTCEERERERERERGREGEEKRCRERQTETERGGGGKK